MSWPFSMVALIPARAGSQRIKGKNTRLLAGHPLIEWTIAAADISNVFDEIVVCSDDAAALTIGQRWGCRLVERQHVPDDQADIDWVRQAGPQSLAFAILRVTSPFRSAETIRRAWQTFQDLQPCDSLRAIRPVTEHPGKMWSAYPGAGWMLPLLDRSMHGTPWHSSPTQELPPFYVQTSSLEIAWTKTVYDTGTISGSRIVPFLHPFPESLALDTERDWAEAERLLAAGTVTLPTVPLAGVSASAPAQ